MIGHASRYVTALLGLMFALAGCGGAPTRAVPPDNTHTAEPTKLEATIATERGDMLLETQYLPGVLQCEIRGVTTSGPALEAQAIAARTYLANYLGRAGTEKRIRVGPRFQCWKTPKSEEAFAAVNATWGVTILRANKHISANYVSGTRHMNIDCSPQPPKVSGYPYETWDEMRSAYLASKEAGQRLRFSGTDWTQILVTTNEAKRGAGVTPTLMAKAVGKNRGALSQNGAICLAENLGYETFDILRYFYGDDIVLDGELAPVQGE